MPVFKRRKHIKPPTSENIIKVIANQMGVEESFIKPHQELIDDIGADSLDCVELIMSLEEEFDIEIADDDAERLKTVQNVIDHVKAVVDD